MLTYVSVIKSFLYFYHISLPFIEQTRVASISRVRLRRLSICFLEKASIGTNRLPLVHMSWRKHILAQTIYAR